MFIASPIFAVSYFRLADISVARVNSFILSTSVGFLMRSENSAAAILSCTVLYPTLVLLIYLLTFCPVSSGVLDAPAAATTAIL